MSARLTFAVERLGHRGDGVAHVESREVFVPYALPGERIAANIDDGGRGRVITIEAPSPDRVEPECPLFTRCGGCALQHLELAAQLAWKRSLVVDALRQRGLDAEVDPCIDAHGEGRRRAVFHLRMVDGALRAGFMEARSHTLVPIEDCPVLAPSLIDAPRSAATLGAALTNLRKPIDAQVIATIGGLDIDLRGAGKIADAQRLRLLDVGATLDLARLSLHGDIIAEWRKPLLQMGKALVTPPPGGFLQATSAGEETLARLVRDGVGAAKRIADLFSGCGTFSLRLAENAHLHAVEFDKAAIDALMRAARSATGLKPITTEMRDLFRRPLTPQELDAFDAVTIDPPRAGAEAQARMLAKTHRLGTIVMASCNPATFARDARILVDGGFRLARVAPVDQFRHSAHVELVAVLRR